MDWTALIPVNPGQLRAVFFIEEKIMKLFRTRHLADIYQVINGISIRLGKAPIRKTSCGWLVCIPPGCAISACSREFRLSFPKRFLRESRCPCLQIRHGRSVYDVFLSRDIFYLAGSHQEGAAYGNP